MTANQSDTQRDTLKIERNLFSISLLPIFLAYFLVVFVAHLVALSWGLAAVNAVVVIIYVLVLRNSCREVAEAITKYR